MKTIRSIWLLFSFSFCLAISANGSELTGAVKSESGKPLGGVRVLTYAPSRGKRELLGVPLAAQRYEVTTDHTGFFRLPSHGRLVYFRRDDLRPLTKILELSATRIEVTLEEGARTVWRIPACSSLSDGSQRIGIGFKVIVPKNMLIKKATQFENGGYVIGGEIRGRIETLIIWSDSTSLEPDEGYFLDSTGLSERAWISGKTLGYEIRGVKRNGDVWRRVSFRWGAITYQGNSKDSAEVFDRLIDAVCFDESNRLASLVP